MMIFLLIAFFFSLQATLQCPDCPKQFPMTSVLKYHREKDHQKYNTKICTVCGKEIRSNKMKTHLLSHSAVKRLQCDKCEYRCNQPKVMERHMYTHSDDPMAGRNYICEICTKAFFTKQELNQHILIHGGIKPYKCKLCNGAFSNFSGHRQHMMKTVRGHS